MKILEVCEKIYDVKSGLPSMFLLSYSHTEPVSGEAEPRGVKRAIICQIFFFSSATLGRRKESKKNPRCPREISSGKIQSTRDAREIKQDSMSQCC